MTKRSVLDFDRPRLFSPTRANAVLDNGGAVTRKNFTDLVDTNIASTSSFRYDPPSLGIRSTQQIPTDFSQFKNHTFFNSAEVNVNVAFDRIINEYPFDGTRREIEAFLDSLTGFEKYVFDSFPRNAGFLFFSGSSSPDTSQGSYIIVNDVAGNLYPDLSKTQTGVTVLDPGLKPFTVEMQIFVPAQSNDCQVICQKISGSQQGITLALSQSLSSQTGTIVFGAVSGSRHIEASATFTKGQFNHIVATFDRRPGVNGLLLYLNESLASTSSNTAEMGQIQFSQSAFTIGSGTIQSFLGHNGTTFTPMQTFSGALDELRVFHAVRPIPLQQQFGKKLIFASSDLKLYYKFNEPTGTLGPDSIVLDSSGNSLHSRISNFSYGLRDTGSLASPMVFEKLAFCPVLFPAFEGVQDLNVGLLTSASAYDATNPNLITRLIPNHYFLEGQSFEGLPSEGGTLTDGIEGTSIPGSAQLGSAQLMATFMYTWAKFFDEIKMMLDLFGTVIHVDYDKPDYTADAFLPFVAEYFGFEMPAFFVNASIEQFIDAENLRSEFGNSELALQFIQNQIWRRILTNLGDVIRSKGTLRSVKTLIRSMGIDPDKSCRIREFGGPTERSLENARESRADISQILTFSGSLAHSPNAVDAHTGIPLSFPTVMSPFLSGSRVEIGSPEPLGPFVSASSYPPNGISAAASDGLFTSGSWTYEALYRFPSLTSGSHAVIQSLARLEVTGSSAPSLTGGLIANLVAVSGSDLTFYYRPSTATGSQMMALVLTGADVMDGRQWSVSFGRQRNDEIGSFASSSFFLRALRQEFGTLVTAASTSSLFLQGPLTSTDVTQNISSFNASGTFFLIGSQSMLDVTSSVFLNDPTITATARSTSFDGIVGQIRFWSKALSRDEWLEHAMSHRSLGVDDPASHFNFVTTATGSFEKIRIDASVEQPVSKSNSDGTFQVFDYSQNNLHLMGRGFEPGVTVLVPERFFFTQLSPKFDESVATNKVRVRSFLDYSNVQLFGGDIAPVYMLPPSERPQDDTRFSIDFSIMDALNDDIVKIFSTFDVLNNALGDPELTFSPDYPALDVLRDVYFKRLTDKVRLKQFFELFKWFDSVLGISMFIEQVIPRKTNFLGSNFVIESHMLERPKLEYQFTDIYLGENNRHGLKGIILLQEFAAILRRY